MKWQVWPSSQVMTNNLGQSEDRLLVWTLNQDLFPLKQNNNSSMDLPIRYFIAKGKEMALKDKLVFFSFASQQPIFTESVCTSCK